MCILQYNLVYFFKYSYITIFCEILSLYILIHKHISFFGRRGVPFIPNPELIEPFCSRLGGNVLK